MSIQHTTVSASAPSSTPIAAGHHYMDTSTGNHYISFGTTSVDDWKLQGDYRSAVMNLSTTPTSVFHPLKRVVAQAEVIFFDSTNARIDPNTLVITGVSDSQFNVATVSGTVTGARAIVLPYPLAAIADQPLADTLIVEQTSPATPPAGKVAFYAKSSDKKLYTKNSLGIEGVVGSGSGSGLKNWVKNSDAEASPTLDVTVGAGVVAPTSSPTALVGVRSFRLTGVATASATTYWQWDCNAIDSFFLGKPLSFELKTNASVASAFKVAIYNVTDSTELPETVVTIPLGSYVAKGFFIPATGKTYAVRITQTTNGTNTCDVDDVFVGEVAVRYGQAVTDWAAYTPTFNASFGTVTSIQFWWRRIGDSLQVKGQFTAGTTTAGNAEISLPNSYITSSLCSFASMSGTYLATNGTAAKVGGIAPRPTYSLVYLDNDASSIPNTNAIVETGATVAVNFTVPITGWSSNVQMADRSLVEYASSTETGVTIGSVYSDTSKTVYGPNGSPIHAISSVDNTLGSTYYRVRFQNPILPTDGLRLEIKQGANDPWIEIGSKSGVVCSALQQNTTQYGCDINRVSGSLIDVDVTFGRGGRVPNGSTFGAVGAAWSGTTLYYRITKISGGAQVGFPIGTRQILGDTSGTAVPAGYLGEKKNSVRLRSAAISLTSNAPTNITSSPITLAPGTWSLKGNVALETSGATSVSWYAACISKTSGSFTALDTISNPTNGEVRIYGKANISNGEIVDLPVDGSTVILTATTTFYLVGICVFTGGSITAYGNIRAELKP